MNEIVDVDDTAGAFLLLLPSIYSEKDEIYPKYLDSLEYQILPPVLCFQTCPTQALTPVPNYYL